jgi:hypothetical protein
MRWNALAMVVRANAAHGELGGHIASYASAADLFEVGFNHVFRARNDAQGGDLVFFQPHGAPGVYVRAFLEGRLTEGDLSHFRQEIAVPKRGARGLASYHGAGREVEAGQLYEVTGLPAVSRKARQDRSGHSPEAYGARAPSEFFNRIGSKASVASCVGRSSKLVH